MKEEEEKENSTGAVGCIVLTAFLLALFFTMLIGSAEPRIEEKKDPGYKIAPTTKSVDSLEII